MDRFSIRQASEQLKISRDTLRYYDKMRLVSPTRGDNNYRYYTVQDIFDLQYVQVLSFTGFSLSEIGRLFELMRTCDIGNFSSILEVLTNKRADLARHVKVFQSMINYIDEAEEAMSNKTGAEDIAKINTLVAKMFRELCELKEEQK